MNLSRHLKKSVNFLIQINQFLIDLIFRLVFFFNKIYHVPQIKADILLQPATKIAEKIRKREVTAVFVLESFITRIKDVNPILNCLVGERFDAALKEAEEVERLLDRDPDSIEISVKNKPFLGVPFTAKESFQIKGLPNTAGLVSVKERVSNCDAPVVQRLKDAGAIALGVTAVPELCMWWETKSNLYGRTRNVYDTRRIVGGSSGGEACLISAAGSIWGIGSDIGGSIRMPAFFNGIFGHKTSRYMVPNLGRFPQDERHDKLLATGPLCRYAGDLIPMLKIMAGSENANFLKLDIPVNLEGLNVISVPDVGDALGISSISKELRQIQKEVEECLRKNGAEVKRRHYEEFEDTVAMWNSSLSLTGSPAFSTLMGLPSDKGISPWKELFLWFFGLSNHTFPAIGLALTEAMNFTSTHVKRQYEAKAAALEVEINELLGENGIMLFPSNANYAYYHNQPMYKIYNCVYAMLFNVLGLPVTQVPLGLGKEGVPIGIQVAAAHNNDRLTIAVAKLLEKEFGGWVEP